MTRSVVPESALPGPGLSRRDLEPRADGAGTWVDALSRGLERWVPDALTTAIVLVAGSLAVGSVARAQSGGDDPRVTVENGIEVIRGTERGSKRVRFQTQRYTLSADEKREIRNDVSDMVRIYRDELGVRVASDFQVDLDLLGGLDARDFEQRLLVERHSTRSIRSFSRRERWR